MGELKVIELKGDVAKNIDLTPLLSNQRSKNQKIRHPSLTFAVLSQNQRVW